MGISEPHQRLGCFPQPVAEFRPKKLSDFVIFSLLATSWPQFFMQGDHILHLGTFWKCLDHMNFWDDLVKFCGIQAKKNCPILAFFPCQRLPGYSFFMQGDHILHLGTLWEYLECINSLDDFNKIYIFGAKISPILTFFPCQQLPGYSFSCRVIVFRIQMCYRNISTASTFGMFSSNFVDFRGQKQIDFDIFSRQQLTTVYAVG